eukprot:gnl/Trimastix_PCT/2948.p1 GENE.gnl/Trimastix_PCT/2948~~gnl/Trimastix_PCT/2948.p1  ORF type:complete len:350 (+),score=99.20 gnl/Trimastix_PCT/2948:38-1087(+)
MSRKHEEKQSGFIAKVKYRNSLPDLPFQPKLLSYPPDPNRFVDYAPTSLERRAKHQLLTEPDLGIHIDLIDHAKYAPPAEDPVQLDPEDLELLPDAETTATRPARSRPTMKWLRKTSYISAEYDGPKYRSTTSESQEPRHAKPSEASRTEQIEAIEETFRHVAVSPVHPTKKDLQPVRVLPVLPDFELWPNLYTHAIFDTDPGPLDPSIPREEAERKCHNAILKASSGPNQAPMVSYFLPVALPEEEDEPPQEFQFERDYTYEVRRNRERGAGSEAFVMYFTPSSVRYHDVHARLIMKKKPHTDVQHNPISLSMRSLTEDELTKRMSRIEELEDEELGPISNEQLEEPE